MPVEADELPLRADKRPHEAPTPAARRETRRRKLTETLRGTRAFGQCRPPRVKGRAAALRFRPPPPPPHEVPSELVEIQVARGTCGKFQAAVTAGGRARGKWIGPAADPARRRRKAAGWYFVVYQPRAAAAGKDIADIKGAREQRRGKRASREAGRRQGRDREEGPADEKARCRQEEERGTKRKALSCRARGPRRDAGAPPMRGVLRRGPSWQRETGPPTRPDEKEESRPGCKKLRLLEIAQGDRPA